ncbi:neuraminidase-like domain-containing protein [Pseudomonas agarici]|uniref:Tc toxin subunit A-related protein n=1 Tax=Pseudomonas agarici TaxID=46677 RepID=UPI0015A2FA59|nr:neuraminidase-like domain-containing protein [Pseudomonas agarici]NWB89621.1 toxin [Pseudomonas agarici]
MSASIDSQLNEALRDALCAYYLDEVVPNDPQLQALGVSDKLKTLNDLYEFLLLDVQVSQDVRSSWVASAIASLQQYVNGVLMAMEPGYEDKTLEPHEIVEWRDRQCQYPLWAANQQLAYHPSIYIDPSLRLKKSSYFRQLEDDINQNKIHLDTTQEAVKSYLARFEEVANLTIVNGYITSTDFANAHYYFIGKSRAERKYYWRSVDMSERPFKGDAGPGRPKVDYPAPGAWSDWVHADLGISEATVEGSIRPVFFNNRLFVIWVDVVELNGDPQVSRTTNDTTVTLTPQTAMRCNLSYKKYDETWSVPLTYIEHISEADVFPNAEALEGVLQTIATVDDSGSLFIALYAGYVPGPAEDGVLDKYAFMKTAQVDKSFNVTPLFPKLGYVKGTRSNLPEVKMPFVLKIGRLFALTNRQNFQFAMPGLRIAMKEVVTSSPHGQSSEWNFSGGQKNIADPSSASDVVYNQTSKALEVTVKTSNAFPSSSTRNMANFDVAHAQGGLSASFCFVISLSTSSEGFFRLLEGSYMICYDVFYFRGSNYRFHVRQSDQGGPNCDFYLRDNQDLQTLSLKGLQWGEEVSLAGKYIKTEVFDRLARSPVSHVGKDNASETNVSNILNVALKSNYLFHHFMAWLKNTPLTPPESWYGLNTNLATTPGFRPIVQPPDALTATIAINQETLLPDWNTAWPQDSKVIPIAHGMYIFEQVTPTASRYVGSALKYTCIELQLEPSLPVTRPLRAPGIGKRGSPTLGIAEFIDFADSDIYLSDGSATAPRQPIRMNTLFARTLVEKANVALESLLSWETQHQLEPPLQPPAANDFMDFNGANGLYFWELFLHLPFAVAHRLNLEMNFNEAEFWLSFIFDPSHKPDSSGRPLYWNVRALLDPGDPGFAARAPVDPDAIASSKPVHYRKAVYDFYLKNLIDRGDRAYRQLTPDSLGEAKLWYVRVLDLLGPRPDVRLIDHWTPITLHQLANDTSAALRDYERRLARQERLREDSARAAHGVATWQFAESPLLLRSHAPDPTLFTLDSPHLRIPMNAHLIEHWNTCESRLHNLRNNLSLDGKVLSLPLFAAPLNPSDLLAAFGQGATGGGAARLLAPDVPPYRFTAMVGMAKDAVANLVVFGNTLLSIIERKEQSEGFELQQRQLWDMAPFAKQMVEQQQKIDLERRHALEAGKASVEQRREFFSRRSDEYVSAEEEGVSSLNNTARAFTVAQFIAEVTANALKPVPSGFEAEGGGGAVGGVANGAGASAGAGVTGIEAEGVAGAMAKISQGASLLAKSVADGIDRTASLRRRHQEWMQAREQAELEIAQIDAQFMGLSEQEALTTIQLNQAQLTLDQAIVTQDFLSKRFTNAQLYQWLNGQYARFYYQLYDSTLSLCLAAQECWRYEKGDYAINFIQPDAWSDVRRGLTAGDSLRMNLQKMEVAYMDRNERGLEITKTVSLRHLKALDPESPINLHWDTLHEKLCLEGSIEFELTQKMFEADYPGHYRRRIKRIGLSLPMVVGPYEDVRAILTQTYNAVVLMPGVPPRENLRASQRIAVSSGIDDDGMFRLNFDDARYLPFELTGAVSRWSLRFANHATQMAALESLTDIIVHVQYSASGLYGEFVSSSSDAISPWPRRCDES